MHGNRFDAFLSRIYYAVGLLYYLGHWVTATGLLGIAGGLTLKAVHPFSGEIVVLSSVLCIWGLNVHCKSYRVQRYSANPFFHHLLDESIYDVTSAPTYRYTKRIRLKALRDGVDYWSKAFEWSGHGNVSITCSQQPVNVPVSSTSIEDEPYGARKRYKVTFSRQLRRGEVVEFAVQLTLTDTEHSARPFLSQTISAPVNEIIFRVKFPNNLSSYMQAIYESSTTTMPSIEKKLAVDLESDEIKWIIKKPRIRRHYQIRWDP